MIGTVRKTTLTLRQQEALATDRHLAVIAGAGSGKTTVLVDRYLEILLGGKAAVEEILVLTYTEKAAGELRRRIAACVELAFATPGLPQVTPLSASIRTQLPSAMIGTIHGFCARMLREYPVEAGVDAAFTVLEGLDQRSMVHAAISGAFHDLLGGRNSPQFRARLFSLLQARGRAWVVRFLTIMVERRDLLGRLTGPHGIYGNTDSEILDFWNDAIREFAGEQLDDPSLLDDLAALCSASRGTADLLQPLRVAPDLRARAGTFLALAGKMFRKDGQLSARFAGSGEIARTLKAQAARVWKRYESLKPILDVLASNGSGPGAHVELLASTRTLLSAARGVIQRYERLKHAGSSLDFEDLQQRMQALLAIDHVRTRLANRFKFVMIDEYQDTNLLQYEILLPLLEGLAKGNLFVVGDPMQSIYGFRGADPAVFETIRRNILEPDAAGKEVLMDESFRMLPDITAFVNLVFGRTAQGLLVQARQNDAGGHVEILLPERSGEDISEGEAVARRILNLCAGSTTVFDRREHPHAAAFGDIAILFRSRTPLPGVEEALVRHGIPYVVSGGVGFFQTQEVLDFFNYFRFLLNPADSLALAGILRSPFFHVSDAALFEIALLRGRLAMWDFLISPAFPRERFPAAARAAGILRDDLHTGLRLVPGELINRIVAETSYASVMARTGRGRQVPGNIEKLRAMALAFTGRGFRNLYDFTERLKGLIEGEPYEGQQPAAHPGNAVRLMTVHAAKGLEFPVVILPGLGRRMQFDAEPYVDFRLGIGFSLAEEDADDRPVPLTAMLKDQSKRKTIEEEMRILYVACTRARDMLILSGRWPEGRDRPEAINWVLAGLGLDEFPGESAIDRTVRMEKLDRASGREVRVGIEHRLRVHVHHPADNPVRVMPSQVDVVPPALPRVLVDPVPGRGAGRMIAVNEIRDFAACPARYYRRQVLGLPADSPEEERRHAEREFVGSVLEHWGLQAFPRSEVEIEARRSVSRLPAGKLEPEAEVRWLVRLAEAAHASEMLVEARSASEALTGSSILMRVGDQVLHDQIPVIFRSSDDVWNVVVVATGEPDEPWLMHLAADSLLVHRLRSASRVRASLLRVSEAKNPLRREYSRPELVEVEKAVGEVMQAIRDGDFTHKESPCPVCGNTEG